jgi:ATP-dependent Clp protease ATP-binding subunit ClpA
LAIRTFENIAAQDFTRDALKIRVSCEETVAVHERLTEQGRAVIDGAHTAAASFGSAYVGTEHVLLALTRTPCAARRILESLGVDEGDVQAAIARHHHATRASEPPSPAALRTSG